MHSTAERQQAGLDVLFSLAQIPPITEAEISGDYGKAKSYERLKHRLIVTILVFTAVAGLYIVQQLLWPRNSMPHGLPQETWSWAGVLWALGFFPAVCELAGLYLWRPPVAGPDHIWNMVCWRIVSKGINVEALSSTIEACRDEMRKMPLFPYVIEVLVDVNTEAIGLPAEGGDLRYIRVPRNYQTPNGTRAKARALNYALETSTLPAKAWIVHLDEESWPTESGIIGIAAAIAEEEKNNPHNPRIGQGTITYHRDWKDHPFFTLSDCIRSGSDKGRLFFSMKIGWPLFGLHGSFIVIRNDVETAMGFDVGPIGSLTEDAWWGTMATAAGVRCRWVDGYIGEQCTRSVPDFLQQRRRWFNGMGRTSLRVPVALRWRLSLMASMFAWAMAPVAWLYTIAHLIDGGYINPWVKLLANFSLGVYIATTLIGLQLNMREHGIRSIIQKIRWSLTWLICLPAFSLMEACAVAYAIVRPAKGFHVVSK